MKCELELVNGVCPFCPTAEESVLFRLGSKTYNGVLCGEHLKSVLPKPSPREERPTGNGRVEVHEFPG